MIFIDKISYRAIVAPIIALFFFVNFSHGQAPNNILRIGLNSGRYLYRMNTFESILAKEELENNYQKGFNYHQLNFGFQGAILFRLGSKVPLYYSLGFMYNRNNTNGTKLVSNTEVETSFKYVTTNYQLSKFYYRINKLMINFTVFDLYFIDFYKKEGAQSYEKIDKARLISTALDFGFDYSFFPQLSIGTHFHFPVSRAVGSFGDYDAKHFQIQLNLNLFRK